MRIFFYLIAIIYFFAGEVFGDPYITSMKIYLQQSTPLYEKAIQQGEEGIKVSPKNWELRALLADCYAHEERFKEASEQYRIADSLDPSKHDKLMKGDGKYLQGLESYWNLAYNAGMGFTVKAGLSEVPYKDISLSDTMKLIAKEYGEPNEVRKGDIKGKVQTIFTYWDKGIDFTFDDNGKLVGRGNLKKCKEKDYLKCALVKLQDAIELNPSEPKAYDILAIVYGKLGMKEKMEEIYKKAIEKNPKNIDAHLNLASYYIDEKRWDDCIKECDGALSVKPDNLRALAMKGDCYSNKEMYADALQSYEKALAIDDKNKDIHFNIGFSYYKLKKYPEAIKSFNKVVSLEPTDVEAWTLLGDSGIGAKDDDSAIKGYEGSVKLKPDDVRIWGNLLILYNRKGMKDKADEAQKKIKELSSKK